MISDFTDETYLPMGRFQFSKKYFVFMKKILLFTLGKKQHETFIQQEAESAYFSLFSIHAQKTCTKANSNFIYISHMKIEGFLLKRIAYMLMIGVFQN